MIDEDWTLETRKTARVWKPAVEIRCDANYLVSFAYECVCVCVKLAHVKLWRQKLIFLELRITQSLKLRREFPRPQTHRIIDSLLRYYDNIKCFALKEKMLIFMYDIDIWTWSSESRVRRRKHIYNDWRREGIGHWFISRLEESCSRSSPEKKIPTHIQNWIHSLMHTFILLLDSCGAYLLNKIYFAISYIDTKKNKLSPIETPVSIPAR